VLCHERDRHRNGIADDAFGDELGVCRTDADESSAMLAFTSTIEPCSRVGTARQFHSPESPWL
jgi:hypothetical protein